MRWKTLFHFGFSCVILTQEHSVTRIINIFKKTEMFFLQYDLSLKLIIIREIWYTELSWDKFNISSCYSYIFSSDRERI